MSGHRLSEFLVENSLDAGRVTTEQKLLRAREALIDDLRREIQNVIDECDNAISLAERIRLQATWMLEDPDKHMQWGSLGEEQGNMGKHLDAHVISAHHLNGLIIDIETILGVEPGSLSRKPPARKRKAKKTTKKARKR